MTHKPTQKNDERQKKQYLNCMFISKSWKLMHGSHLYQRILTTVVAQLTTTRNVLAAGQTQRPMILQSLKQAGCVPHSIICCSWCCMQYVRRRVESSQRSGNRRKTSADRAVRRASTDSDELV